MPEKDISSKLSGQWLSQEVCFEGLTLSQMIWPREPKYCLEMVLEMLSWAVRSMCKPKSGERESTKEQWEWSCREKHEHRAGTQNKSKDEREEWCHETDKVISAFAFPFSYISWTCKIQCANIWFLELKSMQGYERTMIFN